MSINNKKSIEIGIYNHFFKDDIEKAVNSIETNILPIRKVENFFIFEFYNAVPIFSNLLIKTLPNYDLSKKNLVFCTSNNIFGKNLLDACKNLYNSYVNIFYPKNETEKLYELMMTTSVLSNVNIVSINGNKNDCMDVVNEISDKQSEIIQDKNFSFSFFDELNPSVLIPKILYLFNIYFYLIDNKEIVENEKINIFISEENKNFIEAIKIAISLGLPVNNVFFTPIYDINTVKNTIKKVYADNKYLIDPYTACSILAISNYKNDNKDSCKNIILSLSSPYVYARTVDEAIRNTTYDMVDDEYSFFEDIAILSGQEIPKGFINIYQKRIMHYDIINKKDAISYITKLLSNIAN